jgi:hypothetical protein
MMRTFGINRRFLSALREIRRRDKKMLNYENFNKDIQPTESELKDFVGTRFFTDLDQHMRDIYKIKPKLAYSNCAMDQNIWRGWNIKYQKSGKSLCTIYPQQGYFMVLVPGKSFEVRSEADIIEVISAVEMRKEAITVKKKEALK